MNTDPISPTPVQPPPQPTNPEVQPPVTNPLPPSPVPQVTPAQNTVPTSPSLVSSNTELADGMFVGRIGRLDYFIGSVWLLVPLLAVLALFLLVLIAKPLIIIPVIAMFITSIALSVVSIGLGIRRFHDMDQTGWFMIGSFIPFVSTVMAVIMLFWPGTKGENKYGPPYSGNKSFSALVLNRHKI